MKNIKYYAFPSTAKEAVALLLNKKYKAMAVADLAAALRQAKEQSEQ